MEGIQAVNAWLRHVKRELRAKRSKPVEQVPDTTQEVAVDDTDYLVESFIDERCVDGRRYLLVNWVGFYQPTWEPIENIDKSGVLLKLFNKETDPGYKTRRKRRGKLRRTRRGLDKY
ncbi:hypothetical protein AAVH_24461 [Aphelenchoides avenae]|nr:hypothetical protein AAVH_24461 [Aphelenchus avenae]